MAVESSPALLGRLSEFEHHGQARSSGAVAFGAAMAQADRGERAFDGVGRPQVAPVLGGEVVERQQLVAIFLQAFARLGVLRGVLFQEVIECLGRRSRASRPARFRAGRPWLSAARSWAAC